MAEVSSSDRCDEGAGCSCWHWCLCDQGLTRKDRVGKGREGEWIERCGEEVREGKGRGWTERGIGKEGEGVGNGV